MDKGRNCEGKYKPTTIKWGRHVYTQCPVSLLDREACEVIAVVEACEGGMGGGFLPSQYLSETFYYHYVRKIISNEKWKLDQGKGKE